MPTPDQVGSPFRAAGAQPVDRRYGGKITAYDQLPIHALGNDYTVEGSGTVTSLPALPVGETIFLQMAGTPTFTNSAKLICPNGVNYTATSGDLVIARSNGDGVWQIYVNPGSGMPLADRNLSLNVGQRKNAQSNILVARTTTVLTTGSGTYTTPSGCLHIRVRMVGGGGGGQGSGSASRGVGGAGGNTTFGTSLLAANGGAGGSDAQAAVGGTASGGDVNLTGGTAVGSFTAPGNFNGMFGAASPFGGVGNGGVASGAGGAAQPNTGSGGGGGGVGSAVNVGGGGGAGGYVEKTIASPSATYSYAIGPGGTAGTAGTSGTPGGAGGSGLIIIEEFYGS